MAAFYDSNPLLSIRFATEFVLKDDNNDTTNSTINDLSSGTLGTAAQAIVTAALVVAVLSIVAVCFWCSRTVKSLDESEADYDSQLNGHSVSVIDGVDDNSLLDSVTPRESSLASRITSPQSQMHPTPKRGNRQRATVEGNEVAINE